MRCGTGAVERLGRKVENRRAVDTDDQLLSLFAVRLLGKLRLLNPFIQLGHPAFDDLRNLSVGQFPLSDSQQ